MRLFTRQLSPNTVRHSYYVQTLRWFAAWLEGHADNVISRHW